MIKIRYSPPNELELSGNGSELFLLNKEIIQLLSGSQNQKIWKLKITPDPYPYKTILSSLSIELSAALKGKIEVRETQLVLNGNKDFLLNFANNLPYDAEDTKSNIDYHVHYDNLSFGEILSEDSLEIILTKERDCL